MFRAFRDTIRNFWSILGILIGAVSLTNLTVTYFDLGIDPILAGIVDAYRLIFHTAFDYLFFWLGVVWVNFDVPGWTKDLTTIYFVFVSASVRATFVAEVSFAGTRPSFMSTFFSAWKGLIWPYFVASFPFHFLRLRRMLEGIEGRYQPREQQVEEGEADYKFYKMNYDRGFENEGTLWNNEKFFLLLNARLFYVNLIAIPITGFVLILISSGL
jgi:hypothetical protein